MSTTAPSNLQTFTLDELGQFTREGQFDPRDSTDFRVLYAGRDDVHGALKYVLQRCSRSLRMNMYGYDDAELDAVIRMLIDSEHVFVQGTLDKSQAGGATERGIVQAWDPAVRASFAIGESATHQISHTKGGVIDGLVAWEGSTNWSASGEGAHVAGKPYKAQNNTCSFYTNSVEIQRFSDELDEEHAVALQQQGAVTASH